MRFGVWYAMSPITTHNWTRNAEARLIPPFLSGPQTLCACGDGMGSVYRAVDTRLGRKVAIKICAQQFTGRFEREARAISSLNHPHICTLYDVGPNYLVMELVERRSPLAFKKGG